MSIADTLGLSNEEARDALNFVEGVASRHARKVKRLRSKVKSLRSQLGYEKERKAEVAEALHRAHIGQEKQYGEICQLRAMVEHLQKDLRETCEKHKRETNRLQSKVAQLTQEVENERHHARVMTERADRLLENRYATLPDPPLYPGTTVKSCRSQTTPDHELHIRLPAFALNVAIHDHALLAERPEFIANHMAMKTARGWSDKLYPLLRNQILSQLKKGK